MKLGALKSVYGQINHLVVKSEILNDLWTRKLKFFNPIITEAFKSLKIAGLIKKIVGVIKLRPVCDWTCNIDYLTTFYRKSHTISCKYYSVSYLQHHFGHYRYTKT